MSKPAPIARIVVRDGAIANTAWYPQPLPDGAHDLYLAGQLSSDWEPTATAVNALPAPIRRYIMELETRCDPAGDIRELVLLRDEVNALLAKLGIGKRQPA